MLLVGDTGFEPVTSSVSGQILWLGMRGSVASGACGGSPMSALCELVGRQFGRQRIGCRSLSHRARTRFVAQQRTRQENLGESRDSAN